MATGMRKLLLLTHVVTSVGMMGAVAGFLALAFVGLQGSGRIADVYVAMAVITKFLIVPLALASLVIGTVQALSTPWGLFRHYWVMVKLFITMVVLVVLLLQVPSIEAIATVDPASAARTEWARTRFSMVLHASGGLAALLAAAILSVFKPGGLTRYGWNRRVSERGGSLDV